MPLGQVQPQHLPTPSPPRRRLRLEHLLAYATAGNASATVSWTAPSNGTSPITGYTVTPYLGSTAQSTTTVTGSPPVATATVTGLTNGQSYTFTVAATNAVGTSPPSAPSNAVRLRCRQCLRSSNRPAPRQLGDEHLGDTIPAARYRQLARSGGGSLEQFDATTSSVTDSAGDTFTEVSNSSAPTRHSKVSGPRRSPQGQETTRR